MDPNREKYGLFDAQNRKISLGFTNKKHDDLEEKKEKYDASIYLYDEIYEEIQQKKEDANKAKTQTSQDLKKPKYMVKLLDAAKRRQIDNDKRDEAKIQREREEEGDTFADKETFVTQNYKEKIEQSLLRQEMDKKVEDIENKQFENMSFHKFYNNLYDLKYGKNVLSTTDSVDYEGQEQISTTTTTKNMSTSPTTNKIVDEVAKKIPKNEEVLKHKDRKKDKIKDKTQSSSLQPKKNHNNKKSDPANNYRGDKKYKDSRRHRNKSPARHSKRNSPRRHHRSSHSSRDRDNHVDNNERVKIRNSQDQYPREKRRHKYEQNDDRSRKIYGEDEKKLSSNTRPRLKQQDDSSEDSEVEREREREKILATERLAIFAKRNTEPQDLELACQGYNERLRLMESRGGLDPGFEPSNHAYHVSYAEILKLLQCNNNI